jgi:sigma-E factor negative regulatory protein RseA
MSEQIREQVSAFLDGELPNSETELLLKRLTRDGELRESFGRYALIGEAIRGTSADLLTRGFAGRVNVAIDGDAVSTGAQAARTGAPRWWRPVAGVAVAAGVAAVAIVALQQRTVVLPLRPGTAVTAQNSAPGQSTVPAPVAGPVSRGGVVQVAGVVPGSGAQAPREAISYTVPVTSAAAPSAMAPARLTNYVFAHSRYSSGLDQRGVLADLLIEADEQQPAVSEAAAHVVP